MVAALAVFGGIFGGALTAARAGNGPTPLSPAWFAARGGNNVGASASEAAAAPQLQTLQNVQTSLKSLSTAKTALQNALAAQQAATASATTVPNGLSVGGLQLLPGSTPQNAFAPTQTVANGNTQVTVKQTAASAILNWSSFNVGSKTKLTFDQSAGGSAAASWAALNRVTDASANPSQILGQISAQGQVYIINPAGVVFGAGSQVNLHALVASSAGFSDTQFLSASSGGTAGGLYGTSPSFTGATAPIVVAPGATITTTAPASATSAGGFVLLMGAEVQNGGAIATPAGQTVLAAGKNFILQPGYSVTGTNSSGLPTGPNLTATVVGSVVAPVGAGKVSNTGLVSATTGDITMAGSSVTQSGVLLSTTSVSQRGTIHLLSDLLASASGYAPDPSSSVVLAPGSATLILNDSSATTALESQRASALAASIAANQQYAADQVAGTLPALQYVRLPDVQNTSRIEITAGGTVEFQSGSLTMATGGQLAISAGATTPSPPTTGAGRIVLDRGATLDVSGSLAAVLPVSANAVSVQIEGFQLRDDPLNRDTKNLNNTTVQIDARGVVSVPASSTGIGTTGTTGTGVNGYSAVRDYTEGGLLEVSGELGNVGHTIAELTAAGGHVVLSAPLVVTQPGSVTNIAGGAITFTAGAMPQSWLIAANGQLYNANTAPSTLSYVGVYNGQTFSQARWNVSSTYNSPLLAPASIEEPGYLVGRDAGSLTVSAVTSVLAGTIDAGVVVGTNQVTARTAGLTDALLQPQGAVPLGGTLSLGSFGNYGLAGSLTGLETLANQTTVLIVDQLTAPVPSISTTIPTDLAGTSAILADSLSQAQLGGLSITASGGISINAPITTGYGASINLVAPRIEIAANMTARGGSVSVSDTLTLGSQDAGNPVLLGTAGTAALTQNVILAAGRTIDTRGVWTNAVIDPVDLAGEAYRNGGPVVLTSTRGISLGAGSLIDASSGGAVTAQGSSLGGSGGAITINADSGFTQGAADPVTLGGTLRAIGTTGCPTSGGCGFSLTAPSIVIGDGLAQAVAGQVVLPTSFFGSGFLSYTLNGTATDLAADGKTLIRLADAKGNALPGVTVAPGAQVNVFAPTYQFTTSSRYVPTGADPATALTPGLLPLYLPNQKTATLGQRPSANLALNSDLTLITTGQHQGGAVTIGAGASIGVDPGASVSVKAAGAITLAGTISAPGGTISLVNDTSQSNTSGAASVLAYVPGQMILLTGGAVLDVSGRAFTALDTNGRPFGTVPAGGNIFIGGPDVLSGAGSPASNATAAFVVIEPGAMLNASGTAAMIDPAAGLGKGVIAALGAQAGVRPVASPGGGIALNSETGIILDGTMVAKPGGGGVAGGTLSVAMETPNYQNAEVASGRVNFAIPDSLLVGRDIIVEAQYQTSGLAAASLTTQAAAASVLPALIGQARVGTDQIAAGGFASVNLATQDALIFSGSVTLAASKNVALWAGAIGEPIGAGTARVVVSAPYVSLTGSGGQAIYGAIDPAAVVNFIGANGTSFAPLYNSGTGKAPYIPTLINPTASFTIAAGQVDVAGFPAFGEQGDVGLGGSNTVVAGKTVVSPYIVQGGTPAGGVATTDLVGFASVNLRSTGDIRFLANPTGGATLLLSEGDIVLQGQQIYPASNASAAIVAGAKRVDLVVGAVPGFVEQPNGLLTILGTGTAPPALPQAIEGSLTFIASTIDQGGVLRAPLGSLSFGLLAGTSITTSGGNSLSLQPAASGSPLVNRLSLLPGSVTSVSAAGMIIADGGTTDGTIENGGTLIAALPSINFVGAALTEQAGAVLDLSGGGTLAGIGFITGAGGSVDTLATPQLRLGNGGKQSSDPVYAIVVGPQPAVAQASLEGYASSDVGQQVSVPAGVPGLPAGTYTLLPADNALRPGGYRVELTSSRTPLAAPVALADGSYTTVVYATTAGTGFVSPLPTLASVTPAAVVRGMSQYNEETYTQFVQAQAALQAVPRTRVGVLSASGGYSAVIPEDGGQLALNFQEPIGNSPLITALRVAGSNRFAAAAGGYGGEVFVQNFNQVLEITPQPVQIGRGVPGATLTIDAPDLNRLGPSTLAIGGTLDAGATLAAPQIVFTGPAINGTVTTIGQSGSLENSAGNGLTFTVTGAGSSTPDLLLASNALVQLAPSNAFSGPLTIGPNASLAAGGSLAFVAGSLSLPTTAQYGASNIQLATNNLIIGTPAALAAAQSVPTGVTLNSNILAALVAGNPAIGAPPLQSLTLTATSAIDILGAVSLSADLLQQIELNTPSIQGFSTSASDVASITARTFIWNGLGTTTASLVAPAPVAGGAGSGSGSLRISANTIILGYGDGEVPQNEFISLDRVIFGFANVTLAASQALIARDASTLNVYQTGGLAAAQPGSGTAYAGSGGNLTIETPLLTAANAAILQIHVGGPASLISPNGGAADLSLAGQGGEIDLAATAITAATTIAAPAGKLSMLASAGDISLAGGAVLNLAGVTTRLFDQAPASSGGSLVMESASGNIIQAAGSVIDVSAQAAAAGSISATALNGRVGLNGSLRGGSLDGSGGSLTLRTGTLPQASFEQLQTTLNAGGFFGARVIEIGVGDVAVTGGAGATNQVRGNVIDLAADQGSLSVGGVIDASGSKPGAITLSAGNNLTIAAGAVLDAHGRVLQTDSAGQAIDAENQATIQLNVAPGAGVLTLGNGAVLNVSSPDLVTAAGVAPGQVRLSVPRVLSAFGGETGGLNVQVGTVTLDGVGSLVVDAVRAYAPANTVSIAGTPTPTISQADFNSWNSNSLAFIAAAEPGGHLAAALAGQLGAFATSPALHLRPGIEVITPGDLVIAGDINFANYRFASLDPSHAQSAAYGSGEPGALIIRAGGNLTVNGSISDGFAAPNDGSAAARTLNPDDNGWVLSTAVSALLGNVVLPANTVPTMLSGSAAGTPTTATSFAAALALNFPITINANTIAAGVTLPVPVTLGAALNLPAGTTLTASITDAAGVVVPGLAAGNILTTAQKIPAGDILGAGFVTPTTVASAAGLVWPAGASLGDFTARVVLASAVTVGPGDMIPANSSLVTATGKPIALRPVSDSGQGLIYADAAPLPQGTLSWSFDMTAGARLPAANPVAVQPASALGVGGNLVLSDPHVGLPATTTLPQLSYSVIRTGTGDLHLAAGGSIAEATLFGVYTAGAAVKLSAVPSASQVVSDATEAGLKSAGYTTADAANAVARELTGGGNLSVSAQGDLSGLVLAPGVSLSSALNDSAAVGQWLWRQGGSDLNEPASWAVNTGTYAPAAGGNTLLLSGFTGFGTLGGGNVTIVAGGNAGVVSAPTTIVSNGTTGAESGGLVVAVASSSFVDSSGIRRTSGGGTITLNIGGILNPNTAIAFGPSRPAGVNATALDGAITDLRGAANILAGAVGQLTAPKFGVSAIAPLAIYAPGLAILDQATPVGGPALVAGDATFSLRTRGTLVIAGVGDATRLVQVGQPGGNALAQSWFSLWTNATAISLISAGGNVSPVSPDILTQYLNVAYGDDSTGAISGFEMPSQLRVVANAGSILQPSSGGALPILLAPSPSGQLDLLAGSSILQADINVSGADPSNLASVAEPADFVLRSAGGTTVSAANIVLQQPAATKTAIAPNAGSFPLFAFGPDIAAPSLHANDAVPSHVYAGGDIIYSTFGQSLAGSGNYFPVGSSIAISNPTLQLAAKPIWLRAAGDIVGLGSVLSAGGEQAGPMIVLNTSATNLSLVQAGRDIVEANINVYGPGTLELSAGRNFYQAGVGTILSDGAIGAGSLSGRVGSSSGGSSGAGAAIDVLAGIGTAGIADAQFAALYFDPANLADATLPLQDQPGKVLRTYNSELLSFVQARGYTGSTQGALAVFAALDPAVQAPLLLNVLFEELGAAGRAASDPTSRFYKSYLPGNAALSALFPSGGTYQGGVTLYGSAGIKTVNGGSIDLVVPGGVTELGVASLPASASSGVLTQGSGDIGIYSRDSVLLGQSRVFTTFGGGITIWSEAGDINAGQGAKTTQIFTPPGISYDLLGDITLAPTAPATGAGIATLAPVAGVPAGDVVLVAPLGTIDAGEAGIRSTGNVALAASVVLNSSNVQAGGKTTGAPSVPTVDVGAAIGAASVGGSAATSSSTMPANNQVSAPASFITVEVDIGGSDADEKRKHAPKP